MAGTRRAWAAAALLAVTACATTPAASDGSVRLDGSELWIRLTPMQLKAFQARDREHHGAARMNVALSPRQLASLQEALGEEEPRRRVSLTLRSGELRRRGGDGFVVRERRAFVPFREVVEEH